MRTPRAKAPAISLLVASTLVIGCKIDRRGLEDGIVAYGKQHGVELESARCPEREMKQGDEFTCEGKTLDGGSVTISVTQTSATGALQIKLVGTVIHPEDVADSIQKKRGTKVEVQCPSKVVVLKEGDVVSCTATLGGARHKVQIKALSDEGAVDWQLSD